MAFTTDITTDVGKVRLLITDLDEDNPIFPDDTMIEAFLELESDSIKGAGALAYECIAGNQALLLKVISLLDLKQDGKKTAEGLLAVAKVWRDTDDSDDWSGIDFVDITDNSIFAKREYLAKLLEAQS